MSLSKEFPGGITNGAAWYGYLKVMRRSSLLNSMFFQYVHELQKISLQVPFIWRNARLELYTRWLF